MPGDVGLDPVMVVLPVVVVCFIGLVMLTIVAVVISRVIRLSRGGPAADRLRQQLLLQQRQGRHGGFIAARDSQQMMLNQQLLQQQAAIDIVAPTPPGASSS